MGRPKGSTLRSDTKIILALLYGPRRFNEFEWTLVEEFRQDLPDGVEVKNPEKWKRFVRRWKIPRKTLATRLKALVAKGWVVRTVLREHGHHVEYRLNFSRAEEILEEIPMPELSSTRSQINLLKTVDAVVPIKQELPALGKLPHEKILEIYLRLRSGEFVCPKCLKMGEGEKALNVSKDVDGRFYCRNCGEEISLEECNKLLTEISEKVSRREYDAGLKGILRFLDAIDQQLRKRKLGPKRLDDTKE